MLINLRSQDDDPVVVQEHIASQVVMSEIDPEVVIRDRTSLNEDVAYEKLTTSRVDSNNTSRRSEQDTLNEIASRPTPPRLGDSSTSAASSKTTLTRLLKNIYDHIEQIRYGIQKDTYRRCVNNEWLLVGTLVDKVLFFAYCSIVIFCTLVIFKNY